MSGSSVIETMNTLHGSIERIIFHNPDNGFCVLKVKAQEHEDLVIVVGRAQMVSPGEYIECRGQWVHDRQFGQQFKADELKIIQPTHVEGMEKYLGSGVVKGIGPHTAKILIEKYGAEVFNIIEKNPEKLLNIPGIGAKRLELITTGWEEQMRVREIMVFLQSHGLGTARALRIYKTYGDQAIQRVKENPYRLALDIPGVGFKTADELAQSLGVARDSLQRAQAGVRHVLQEFAGQGHCVSSQEELIKQSIKLLEISEEKVLAAIQSEVKFGHLVMEGELEPTYMLPTLYQAELGVSLHFERLLAVKTRWHDLDVEAALPWVESRTGTVLSPLNVKR